ncbi:hypothetical protein CUMW_259860 [Citrus unshiu]|uniref:F-box/LRR-repeat protein 15/At3g58940/PEG3-like LRR domain-containing protein n=1 Tax=Citrus unshiu TaxID=55188 RepID=A0A2H5QTC0_CITUN|nr:hypothetical protein CUMW_259860 [Citrus unshiu]
MERKTNPANADMISALPAPILHHILSFLSIEQVVQLVYSLKHGNRNYRDSYYNMPQLVFYAKSMALLELDSCKLESPRGNVTFSCLRELRLRHVCANDQVIKDLITGCLLIELISIISCQGLKHLELLNLGKLKEFKVYDEYGLEQLECDPQG